VVVIAFGYNLKEPHTVTVYLKPIVEQAMPLLGKMIQDESVNVADALTIVLVSEIIPDAVVIRTNLQFLKALISGWTAEPRFPSKEWLLFPRLAEAACERVYQVRFSFKTTFVHMVPLIYFV